MLDLYNGKAKQCVCVYYSNNNNNHNNGRRCECVCIVDVCYIENLEKGERNNNSGFAC